MKRLFALLFLGLIVFVAIDRQRIFLRDPLATVTRDGMPTHGVQVMINYSNDVLLQDDSKPPRRVYLLQHWNKVAEIPTAPLACLQFLVCLTDADQATATKLEPGSRGRRSPFEGVTMTDRRVEFVDEDGALVTVQLR